MGFVLMENLEAGMVLAEDLFTERGQFVLAKGAVLAVEHLAALRRWGVYEADIEGVSQDAIDGVGTATPEQVACGEAFTQQRFALNNLADEVVAAVFSHSLELTVRRFQRGWQAPNSNLITSTQEGDKGKQKPTSDELVRGKVGLASLPDVYLKIIEALNLSGCSAQHLADVVSKDSSIALRLLKLVNSAYYGLPKKVESIPRAITMMGTQELLNLAMGITIVRQFRNIPSTLIDMEVFWRHSIRTALYSQTLARRVGGLDEDQYFIGGLLHDVGRLVMLVEIPEWYAGAFTLAQEEGLPLYHAEKRMLVYDHAMIGRKLCELWRLSRSQSQMIGWHHKPQGDSYSKETCIVHVADFLAHAFGEETLLAALVPELNLRAWEVIGLPQGAIPQAAQQVERVFDDIIRMFLEDDANL